MAVIGVAALVVSTVGMGAADAAKGLRGLDLPDALSGVYCAVERPAATAAAAGVGYLGVKVVCTCSLGGVGLEVE